MYVSTKLEDCPRVLKYLTKCSSFARDKEHPPHTVQTNVANPKPASHCASMLNGQPRRRHHAFLFLQDCVLNAILAISPPTFLPLSSLSQST